MTGFHDDLPGLLSSFALLALTISVAAASQPGKTQQITSPDLVPEGLGKSDWQSIRAAYDAGRHAFQPIEDGWQARNPGQQWITKLDGRGFMTEPRGGAWQWGLALESYGFPGAECAIRGVPAVKVEGPRLSYGWDTAVEEWWVNDARGLEHGFTVKERPRREKLDVEGSSLLTFTLSVRGNLTPVIAADAAGVEFRDGAGAAVLTYAGLKVWDADGTVLRSHFELSQPSTHVSKPRLRLLVEERGARYPITIDPIAQQAFLKPADVGNTLAGDAFGEAVAVSGDTVVIGAPFEDSSSAGVNSTPNEAASGAGATYVFVRTAGVWTQQAYLKPGAVGTTQGADTFGIAVAISGDTIVVGAPREDSSTTGINSTPNESADGAGAAYIFTRSGTTWTQQAYLKPAAVGTAQTGDGFGTAVAIEGDTVMVGAPLEDSTTVGVNNTPNDSAGLTFDSGAVYVFTRSGTTWTQQAYLKTFSAGSTHAGDQFGSSVSIAGDTAIVGALREDSSSLGTNSAPNESAADSGAAYVFTRSGGAWALQAYLKPAAVGATQAGDRFGQAVSIAGDTVVVGAFGEASGSTGVNSTPNENTALAGAAYVFLRTGTIWSQQAYLKPAAAGTTQINDNFGFSVAIAGDTVVVGAQGESSNTTGVNSTPNESAQGSGAAYVFTRSGGAWTQQSFLKPAVAGASQVGDGFGHAVAISGETVVIGAVGEDSGTKGVNSAPNENADAAGAANVFERSAGAWTQQAYVKPGAAGGLQADDEFGTSVGIAGDTVVVGAPGEDSSSTGVNSAPNESAPIAGAAYVFVRSGTIWTQQAYLKPAAVGTTQAGDAFGGSVAISGDTIVVGAFFEDSSATGVNSTPNEAASGAGAAYVFVRSGTTWTQQAYLKPAAVGTTQAGDEFGASIAVAGDIVVVGAYREDSSSLGVNGTPNDLGGATDAGAAYVFTRSGTTWTQQAYLKQADFGSSLTGDFFGFSVAVSGETAVIGAPLEDCSTTGVNSTPNDAGGNDFDAGAAYVFTRSGTAWTQQAYLKPAAVGTSQELDTFGISVGVSGDTVIVGAPREDSNTTGVNSTPNDTVGQAGAAYVFIRNAGTWSQQAYLKPAAVGTTQQGDFFGRSVAVSGQSLIVGAPSERSTSTGVNSTPDEGTTNAGAVYVFGRIGTAWSQQAYLKPAAVGTFQGGDQFGRSVAISGQTVIVGAPFEDSSTTGVSSTPNDLSLDAGAAYLFPVSRIIIQQPAGTGLLSGVSSIDYGAGPQGFSSAARTFTIGNVGTSALAITGIGIGTVAGHAGDFVVNTAGTPSSLPAGGSTTFAVTFAPTAAGPRATTLRIVNGDPFDGIIDIALTGLALSYTSDADGDGLNDAAEFQLAALGFDRQVSQPALVNTLFANANGAGLFTDAQVKALNIDVPVLTRDAATGRFKLTIGVQKTADLAVPFANFRLDSAGSTTVINGAGKLEFEFTVPDNAAFFRLETQ